MFSDIKIDKVERLYRVSFSLIVPDELRNPVTRDFYHRDYSGKYSRNYFSLYIPQASLYYPLYIDTIGMVLPVKDILENNGQFQKTYATAITARRLENNLKLFANNVTPLYNRIFPSLLLKDIPIFFGE